MCPALKAALTRSGISSKIAGQIRDNPSGSGGASTLSLFHYMGTARTSLFVEQLFRGTSLGFSIITCIDDLVLDTGRYGLLWNMPFPIITKYVDAHSQVYAVVA